MSDRSAHPIRQNHSPTMISRDFTDDFSEGFLTYK
jgi:hypothetical protein